MIDFGSKCASIHESEITLFQATFCENRKCFCYPCAVWIAHRHGSRIPNDAYKPLGGARIQHRQRIGDPRREPDRSRDDLRSDALVTPTKTAAYRGGFSFRYIYLQSVKNRCDMVALVEFAHESCTTTASEARRLYSCLGSEMMFYTH